MICYLPKCFPVPRRLTESSQSLFHLGVNHELTWMRDKGTVTLTLGIRRAYGGILYGHVGLIVQPCLFRFSPILFKVVIGMS